MLEEANNKRNAILQTHSILGHFGIWMATSDMPQGTNSSINNLLTAPSTSDDTKKSLYQQMKYHYKSSQTTNQTMHTHTHAHTHTHTHTLTHSHKHTHTPPLHAAGRQWSCSWRCCMLGLRVRPQSNSQWLRHSSQEA